MENKLRETLHRYFTRLSLTGYIPDNNVFQVVVLMYINDIWDYPLTIEQQGIVRKALSCLQGTCLIPYNSCIKTCV